MNPKSLLFLPALLATATALTFTGCGGGDQPKTAGAAVKKNHDSEDHQDADPSTKKPRIGMTQNQIRSMYGDPSNTSQTGDGEIWTYWFNKGHAFIPYNYGYRAKTGTFFFNNNGTLKNFNIND